MPIKPENRLLYPGGSPTSPEWKALRARILEREGHACKWCKAPNHRFIVRSDDGSCYYLEEEVGEGEGEVFCADTGQLLKANVIWYNFPCADNPYVEIILTIAHLDQDPTNNTDENLAALCQQCHNRHDAPHRAKNAAKTRHAKKSAGDLFGYVDEPPAMG